MAKGKKPKPADDGDNARLIEAVRAERAARAAEAPEREQARHQLQIVGDQRTGRILGFGCACKLWELKMPLGGDPAAMAAATEDILARHREHVMSGVSAVWTFGYGVRCRPFTSHAPDGTSWSGHFCSRDASRNRCQACRNDWAEARCDYPVGGPCKTCKGAKLVWDSTGKAEPAADAFSDEQVMCEDCAGSGLRLCNLHLCGACRWHVEPDEDYCPDHRARVGAPPLVRREECVWLDGAKYEGKCLRAGCGRKVEVGERCLYFPERRRVMCEPDGEEYLRVSV